MTVFSFTCKIKNNSVTRKLERLYLNGENQGWIQAIFFSQDYPILLLIIFQMAFAYESSMDLCSMG